jgi:hypothetical protein
MFRAARYSCPMEWMLQVVDEFDDWLSALRHQALGFYCEIGMTLAGIAAMAAMIAAAMSGANALLIATAVGLLGAAAFLKLQGLLRA